MALILLNDGYYIWKEFIEDLHGMEDIDAEIKTSTLGTIIWILIAFLPLILIYFPIKQHGSNVLSMSVIGVFAIAFIVRYYEGKEITLYIQTEFFQALANSLAASLVIYKKNSISILYVYFWILMLITITYMYNGCFYHQDQE